MKPSLYLCGAGNAEGVRLALRINELQQCWKNIVILDDNEAKHGTSILGVAVAGPFALLGQVDKNAAEVANMVARTTARRSAAFEKIRPYGLPFARLIDPGVDIWGVEFGSDIAVYQNVTFSAGAVVGEGSVIFTGSVVGHGCTVGRCCVIAPGAVINARVVLGDGAYIGTNASILPDLQVGAWATIGANSAVMQDVPPRATAIGVPASIVTIPDPDTIRAARGKSHARSPGRDTVFRKPTTATEQLIAEIWARVLNTDTVGCDDDFFELGGNSLAAVQISFEIQKALHVAVPLQMFFDAPTVAALSARIDEESGVKEAWHTGADKTAEALKKLKQLTKEEKEDLLRKAGKTHSAGNTPDEHTI